MVEVLDRHISEAQPFAEEAVAHLSKTFMLRSPSIGEIPPRLRAELTGHVCDAIARALASNEEGRHKVVPISPEEIDRDDNLYRHIQSTGFIHDAVAPEWKTPEHKRDTIARFVKEVAAAMRAPGTLVLMRDGTPAQFRIILQNAR